MTTTIIHVDGPEGSGPHDFEVAVPPLNQPQRALLSRARILEHSLRHESRRIARDQQRAEAAYAAGRSEAAAFDAAHATLEARAAAVLAKDHALQREIVSTFLVAPEPASVDERAITPLCLQIISLSQRKTT